MSKIKNQKIEDFIDTLSSSSPTPGGGSAASLAGAISFALVSMVAELSVGKEKYKKVEKRMRNIAKESEGAAKKLMVLADRDADAFDKVITAYRSKSKPKIKQALYGAIEAPQNVKKLAKRAEVLGKLVARQGNKNASSDAKSAIHLARAAQKMADENIKINRQMLVKLQ